MIKKIIIQNMYGIQKETILDFEQKHLKEKQIGSDNKNGIVLEGGQKIMLMPTLIGKNASGKTSVLKAVETILNVNSIEDVFALGYKTPFKDLLDNNKKFTAILFERFFTKINDILIRSNKEPINVSLYTIMKSTYGDEASLCEFLQDVLEVVKDLKQTEIDELKLTLEEASIRSDVLRTLGLQYDAIQKKNPAHIFETLFVNKTFENFRNIASTVPNGDLASNLINANNTGTEIKGYVNFSDGSFKQFAINSESVSFEDSKRGWKNKMSIDAFWDMAHEEYESMGHYGVLYYFIISFYEGFSYDEIEENLFSTSNNIAREMVSAQNNTTCLSLSDIHVNKMIELLQSGYSEKEYTVLETLVKKTSFNWVEKLLKSLDSNISHIELASNQSVIIKNKNGINVSKTSLSTGTWKAIFICSFIIENKYDLFIYDEIENGLNTSLVKLITDLACSPVINKRKMQLMLTTHSHVIFSKKIISPYNAFVNVRGMFEKPNDIEGVIVRTEDYDKLFNDKNYSSESFWFKISNGIEMDTNTISNEAVNSLVDELSATIKSERVSSGK